MPDARAKLLHASFTISTREVRTNTITASSASYAEGTTLADLASAPNIREGLNHLGRALVRLFQNPKEQARRKVSIQFWAESLLDKGIRRIAERGIRQRDRLTSALRDAQQRGELPGGFDADATKSGSRGM